MEINIIPKFLDEALTPVAKETGEILTDIVSLVFTPLIKAKAKRDKNLEIFLKKLDEEVDKIPEDKLQNPRLCIAGPALEFVGKYYHEEEYLREMFAKLISASVDSRKIENIHPIFTDIIGKLSSNDAKLLKSIFLDRKEPSILFYFSANKIAFSLDILNKLGLLEINQKEYKRMFKEEDRIYGQEVRVELADWDNDREKILSRFEYYDIDFEEEGILIKPYKKIVINNLNEKISYQDIRCFNCYFPLTLLGKQFCEICIAS